MNHLKSAATLFLKITCYKKNIDLSNEILCIITAQGTANLLDVNGVLLIDLVVLLVYFVPPESIPILPNKIQQFFMPVFVHNLGLEFRSLFQSLKNDNHARKRNSKEL